MNLDISQKNIEKELLSNGCEIAFSIEDTVDSTNDRLKNVALNGGVTDSVLVALHQTAGRGRMGRSFFSPEETGLYMSFLLHPEVSFEKATNLTTLACVALAVTIEEIFSVNTGIKWVNDIWVDNKKVAGILTEAKAVAGKKTPEYVIVGIGVNLCTPERGFPEELRDIAGAVTKESSLTDGIKERFIAKLVVNFMKYYGELTAKTYLEDYRKRCFVIGRDVTLMSSEHEELICDPDGPDRVHAHVLGVDDDCHLHLRYPDGYEEYMDSGEISISL